MSLMVKVLFAAKAKSTHHKIALDALPRLTCRDASAWQEVFLRYHDPYLVGAKAPDDQFKDFRNHVLHVHDGFWGGAPTTAATWYAKTVVALRDQNWVDAAYCAGVLSHYVTDPVMPLHTGQSEAEGPVHRPAEWSITKSYETLRDILRNELGGYPSVPVPSTDDWLGDMIRSAAVIAHQSYEPIIDRYNLALGVDDPPLGLDRELQVRIARLIGLATEVFAQVLSRAIEESHQPAPPVDLKLDTFVAALNMPLNLILKKISDVKERMQVEAMYREFQQTGKVIDKLPEDDRLVRQMHAEEVLGVPVHQLDAQPIRRIGALHGAPPAPPKRVAPMSSAATPVSAVPPIRVNSDSPTKPVLPISLSKPDVAAPNVAVPQKPVSTTRPIPISTPQPATVARSEPLVIKVPEQRPATNVKLPDPFVPTTAPKPFLVPPPIPLEPIRVNAVVPELPQQRIASPKIEPVVSPASFAVDSIFAGPILQPSPRIAPLPTTNVPTTPISQPFAPKVIATKSPFQHEPAESDADQEPRYYLDRDRPVVDAPSIGPKTADRLQVVGIETVGDLLDCDPHAVAAQLDVRHISATTVREWQCQAQLVCEVAGLRGHDAQILVACEVSDAEELSVQNPTQLLDKVEAFLETTDGERILRGANRPDLAEVTDWIQSARRWPVRRAA